MIPTGIVTTAWPRVVAQCEDMGIRFDSWQDGAGKVILGKRADGKYAATVGGVVLSIPRQVGKTFLVGAIIIALCIIYPGLTVLWTAHRTRTTTKTFGSLKGMTSRKKVKPYMLEPRNANGEQEIRFRNGSIIMFGAREQGFGRGFDEVDVEVFDEAQILSEKALEDMVPATNQARHPAGALLFFMGTPPRPTDPGDEFYRRRKKALSGRTGDMVYIEFSADQDADPDDQRQWAKANPSFPSHTPLESMLRMREQLTDDSSFRREGLGIWDEQAVEKWQVIPEALWSSRKTEQPPADDAPPSSLAVDMTHDRTIAIAGAWRSDATTHVELLAVGPDDDSVLEWLVERAGRRIPVYIDFYSPASYLVPLLKSRRVKVVTTSSGGDMSKACGGFLEDVESGLVTHADQEILTDSVQDARKRKIGDAGGWGWDRRDHGSPIAPLVAVTLARHGAVQKRERSGEAVFR